MASGEFPQFTEFTAQNCHVDDSDFLKAVKNGKFPNLKRIQLKNCTMSDCEWPEVSEFSLTTYENFDKLQM